MNTASTEKVKPFLTASVHMISLSLPTAGSPGRAGRLNSATTLPYTVTGQTSSQTYEFTLKLGIKQPKQQFLYKTSVMAQFKSLG